MFHSEARRAQRVRSIYRDEGDKRDDEYGNKDWGEIIHLHFP